MPKHDRFPMVAWACSALIGFVVCGCGLWVGNPKPKDESTSTTKQNFARLPLLGPQLRAALPSGLVDVNAFALLESDEFKNRFFKEGPTSILRIIEDIDRSISSFNERFSETPFACMDQEPVAYELTPFGEEVSFYAQCYENLGEPSEADPSLVQYGRHDGKTYLYYAHGQQRAGIIATPIDGEVDRYRLEAWMGVGYLNTDGCAESFDGCSYGAIRITADSKTRNFEMTVAGIGFGYCGAQLRSDGEKIYAIASVDRIACEEPDTLCAQADSLDPASSCESVAEFSLPPLGRDMVDGSVLYEASRYPSDAPNIILNGTASDSLYFGPLAPTEGVGVMR